MMITLKGLNSQLVVEVVKRKNENSKDFWDANWLASKVEIFTSNFNAKLFIYLRSDDFERFLDSSENGENSNYIFNTVEETLFFKISNEETYVTGTIKDIEELNSLDFTFDTTKQDIEKFIDEVELLIAQFPVRGKENVPPND
ncbi:MAG: hypothetical protein AAGF89_07225 [Bacteroidota bacterium]